GSVHILSRSYGGPMKRLTLAAFLCVLLLPPLWSQFELGSIVGVVTDPSKVAVSGATVELRSLSTNRQRAVLTSPRRQYDSRPLQRGSYVLPVRHQGFREQTREATPGVGQRVQADFALQLGAVSEKVDVTATTSLIETASS